MLAGCEREDEGEEGGAGSTCRKVQRSTPHKDDSAGCKPCPPESLRFRFLVRVDSWGHTLTVFGMIAQAAAGLMDSRGHTLTVFGMIAQAAAGLKAARARLRESAATSGTLATGTSIGTGGSTGGGGSAGAGQPHALTLTAATPAAHQRPHRGSGAGVHGSISSSAYHMAPPSGPPGPVWRPKWCTNLQRPLFYASNGNGFPSVACAFSRRGYERLAFSASGDAGFAVR